MAEWIPMFICNYWTDKCCCCSNNSIEITDVGGGSRELLRNRQNLSNMVRDCRRMYSLKLFFVVLQLWFFSLSTTPTPGLPFYDIKFFTDIF